MFRHVGNPFDGFILLSQLSSVSSNRRFAGSCFRADSRSGNTPFRCLCACFLVSCRCFGCDTNYMHVLLFMKRQPEGTAGPQSSHLLAAGY